MDDLETDLDGKPIFTEPRLLYTIEADDPRFTPTKAILVETSAEGWSLDALERLTNELRDECVWGVGAFEDYRKSQGGIGASGVEILSVTLGVIGAIPTVEWLLYKLNRRVPPRPNKDEALDAAKWAVVLRYKDVSAGNLTVLSETEEPTHWTFRLRRQSTDDTFEVAVYGDQSLGTSVRTVAWTNGDPYGAANSSEA